MFCIWQRINDEEQTDKAPWKAIPIPERLALHVISGGLRGTEKCSIGRRGLKPVLQSISTTRACAGGQPCFLTGRARLLVVTHARALISPRMQTYRAKARKTYWTFLDSRQYLMERIPTHVWLLETTNVFKNIDREAKHLCTTHTHYTNKYSTQGVFRADNAKSCPETS